MLEREVSLGTCPGNPLICARKHECAFCDIQRLWAPQVFMAHPPQASGCLKLCLSALSHRPPPLSFWTPLCAFSLGISLPVVITGSAPVSPFQCHWLPCLLRLSLCIPPTDKTGV